MASDIYQALLFTIKRNNPEDLAASLDKLSSAQIQNLIDQDGNKLVLRAVSDGKAGMVRVLLEKGFRSNGLGTKKYSPLQVAICKKAINIVSVLLEYGAKPEKKLQKDIKHCEYCKGKHKASDCAMSILIGCHFDATSLKMYIPMLAKCVNKTKYDVLADGTPVIYHVIGSSSCDVDEVRAIYKAGGDVLKPDQWGVSPITRAVDCKRFTIASYLRSMSSPRNLSIQDACDSQRTPIQNAVAYCFHDVLLQLCEQGAPVNINSKEGTPLYMAINYRMCLKCVRILIENGANINLMYNHMTPIHVCIKRKCKPAILKYLLDCPKTNIGVLDADKYTYLDTVLHEICDQYTIIYSDIGDMGCDELESNLRNFENLLEMSNILFMHMVPITLPGIKYIKDILRDCSRTINIAADAIRPLQERTLRSVSLMTRAYLSQEKAIREAINTMRKDAQQIGDTPRCNRVRKMASALQKFLGVKRLDFTCKISIRKHYRISELECLPKEEFYLPSSIVNYISDNNYSSRV